jgi:hypothetical protein
MHCDTAIETGATLLTRALKAKGFLDERSYPKT